MSEPTDWFMEPANHEDELAAQRRRARGDAQAKGYRNIAGTAAPERSAGDLGEILVQRVLSDSGVPHVWHPPDGGKPDFTIFEATIDCKVLRFPDVPASTFRNGTPWTVNVLDAQLRRAVARDYLLMTYAYPQREMWVQGVIAAAAVRDLGRFHRKGASPPDTPWFTCLADTWVIPIHVTEGPRAWLERVLRGR